MKTFNCTCGQILFFESVSCTACSSELGFLQDLLTVSGLDPGENNVYTAKAASAQGRRYKKCRNYAELNICTWMIPAESENETFCVSCRLNTVIPDLTLPQNTQLWALIEAAKRRFIYSALRLKLPLNSRLDDPINGLGFRFLADVTNPDGSVIRAITAHEEGLITLNIEEADDAVREKNRVGLREPYRTLLGHFRHESGHYYWDRLVRDSSFLEPCRKLFGDERDNYDEAQLRYYNTGAPLNWQNSHISAYATMHPWEDWAETWAHFLHIQDALEVAANYGFVNQKYRIAPQEPASSALPAVTFEDTMEKWAELTLALNSLNRSMGLRDLYPFVLSLPVIEKLRFVSDLIAGGASSKPA